MSSQLSQRQLQKHRVMFIRINRLYRKDMSTQELYDAVRWCWRVNMVRAGKCELVFAVYKGKVVAVYENPQWEKVTRQNCQNAPAHCEKPESYIGRCFFTAQDISSGSTYTGCTLENELLGSRGCCSPVLYNYR